MTSLSDLIASYSKTGRQKAAQIRDQLNRLQQQLGSQLLTIRQRESEFIAIQESILDEIRPLLALNARSLLSVDEFEQFVRSLLEDIDAVGIKSSLSLQISPNPSAWILHTLPMPLQLGDIAVVGADKPTAGTGGIRLQVEIGSWQQLIFIPVAGSQSSWLAIAQQMQEQAMELPIAANSQEGLMQELVILLVYVGSLFWVDQLANQQGMSSVFFGALPVNL